MVSKSGFVSLVAAAVATVAAGAVNASVISGAATLTESSTAPTGTVIASNLPSSGITAQSGSLNYYTGTQISPMPGETFTTGSTATSITDVVVNLVDAGNATSNSPLYLYLGPASGTTAFTGTNINEYYAAAPAAGYTSGGYLTFALATPFAVSANTQYVYAVSSNAYGATGNTGTYMGLGLVESNGNGTASQQLGTFQFDSTGNTPTASTAYTSYTGTTAAIGSAGTDNAAFEALGTTSSIPEPATLGLLGMGALGLLLLKKRTASA